MRSVASLAFTAFTAFTASAASPSASSDQRPRFHFAPASDFTNDIQGPFYDPRHRLYHVGFAWHVNSSRFVRPNRWYHIVSRDLAHWQVVSTTPDRAMLSPDMPTAALEMSPPQGNFYRLNRGPRGGAAPWCLVAGPLPSLYYTLLGKDCLANICLSSQTNGRSLTYSDL